MRAYSSRPRRTGGNRDMVLDRVYYASRENFIVTEFNLLLRIYSSFCRMESASPLHVSGVSFMLGVVIGVPTVALVLFTAFFCISHACLLWRGQTTREFLRAQRTQPLIEEPESLYIQTTNLVLGRRGPSFLRAQTFLCVPCDAVLDDALLR